MIDDQDLQNRGGNIASHGRTAARLFIALWVHLEVSEGRLGVTRHTLIWTRHHCSSVANTVVEYRTRAEESSLHSDAGDSSAFSCSGGKKTASLAALPLGVVQQRFLRQPVAKARTLD
jgi:hypothetical protein